MAEPKINQMLGQMKRIKASDLHLTEGQPPKMRIHGELHPLDMPVLDHPTVVSLLEEIVTPDRWERFEREHDLDFAHTIPGYARYRTNYYVQQYGYGAVFRMIPDEVIPMEVLGLPNSVLQFVNLGAGLVIVTGPTGSGKTTTLATIIDYINRNYTRHIITIEEPIEFVHPAARSLVTQREVGLHTRSFSDALKHAMRQDPNVILVGEMRDTETIGLALTVAEMGILVFGTLHTNSASKTVHRVVDVFPAEEQERIRTMFASSLTGIIAQQLCLRADGSGRVAAFEILVSSPALGNYIRTDQVEKIDSMIQSGGSQGMQTMDSHLTHLLETGTISGGEAYQKAFDKRMFEKYFDLGEEEDFTA